MQAKLTAAGRKMLANYLALEAGERPAGRWPDFYSLTMVSVMIDGRPAQGMVLHHGDGGAKAVAMKLARDGYGILRWNTERVFVITAAGRAAFGNGSPNPAGPDADAGS